MTAFHREPRSVDMLMGLSDFATQGCTMPGKKTTHPHILSPKFVVKNSWWIESHGESNPYQKNHQQNRIQGVHECFYPKFLASSLGSPNCMILIEIYTIPETNSHFGNLKNGTTGKGASFKHQFSVANSLIVSRRVLYSMKKRARNEHHDFSCKDGSYLEL